MKYTFILLYESRNRLIDTKHLDNEYDEIIMKIKNG